MFHGVDYNDDQYGKAATSVTAPAQDEEWPTRMKENEIRPVARNI